MSSCPRRFKQLSKSLQKTVRPYRYDSKDVPRFSKATSQSTEVDTAIR